MDEQNKQTQTYRSLSGASKKDSGEDFNKEMEAPSKSLGWLAEAAREGAQGQALQGGRVSIASAKVRQCSDAPS